MFLWLQDYKVVASLVLQKPVQIRAESLSNHSTHPVLVWSQWSGEMPQKILKRRNKSEISPRYLQLIPPKMMTDLYTTCGAPVKRLARWKCFFFMNLFFYNSLSVDLRFCLLINFELNIGSPLVLTMKPGRAVIITRPSPTSLTR